MLYLSLTEFEVRTVSCGPSFFTQFKVQARGGGGGGGDGGGGGGGSSSIVVAVVVIIFVIIIMNYCDYCY